VQLTRVSSPINLPIAVTIDSSAQHDCPHTRAHMQRLAAAEAC
jgi:hypothetical protein